MPQTSALKGHVNYVGGGCCLSGGLKDEAGAPQLHCSQTGFPGPPR